MFTRCIKDSRNNLCKNVLYMFAHISVPTVTLQSSIKSYCIHILPMDITSKQLNMQSSLENYCIQISHIFVHWTKFYYIN